MSRHDMEHNRNRTRERPRDDYGRFESEADWRRDRDARRFAGDDYYGWRDQERRGANFDREYQGGNDWSRGYEVNAGNDRYDREFRQPGYYQDRGDGRSSYGRPDQRTQEYRGASRYEYDRPQYSRPTGLNDEYNWTGGSSPGNSYRVESLFGPGNGGYRGNVASDRPLERSSYMASYAGKGPKGYRRPDDRIEEDVNEALSQSPEIDASDIEVKVSNGEVTLTGSVTERHYKRMAEDIVERCAGVHDVHNEIRVQRDAETVSPQQMRSKPSTGAGNKSAEAKTA
jgi:hypothetical protein